VAEQSHADLRAAFGPVRDQGRRPTCLVFAASSAHEHARNHSEPLSPEALFAGAKTRDGLPATKGTTMSAALAAAEEDGQCDESAWPYGDAAATDATATYYRARGAARTRSGLVDATRKGLGDGDASLLVLRVTEAWFGVGNDGLIPGPGTADQTAGLHGVVAVGYDDSRRQLIIRNSWGSGWGDGGYALLSYEYLERYGVEAVRLEAVPVAASA
jgi:C1A family cysteine protease